MKKYFQFRIFICWKLLFCNRGQIRCKASVESRKIPRGAVRAGGGAPQSFVGSIAKTAPATVRTVPTPNPHRVQAAVGRVAGPGSGTMITLLTTATGTS